LAGDGTAIEIERQREIQRCRAQELRQASPLVTLLPDDVRRDVLAQVRALKKGVRLGDIDREATP